MFNDFRSMGLPIAWAALAIGAGLANAAPAHAQVDVPPADASPAEERPSTPVWRVALGPGVAILPEYEGSDRFDLTPVPVGSITYRDRVRIDLRGLSLHVVRAGAFEAGVGVGYGRGRDTDDAPSGLDDIDDAARLRAFANYSIGSSQLGLTVSRDVGGTDGILVELSGGTAARLGPRTMLNAGVTATWADSRHMEGSFGITRAQALRSGLPEFDAGAEVKRIDLAVGIQQDLGSHLFLRTDVLAGYLLGDAGDSPITRDRVQPMGLLGIGYRF